MSDGTTAYEFNGTLGDVDRIVRKLVRLYGLDAAARYGFTYPHSWRGAYDEVAFETCGRVTLRQVLADVEGALNGTFTGWKGGEYSYDHSTPVHLDSPGRCDDIEGGRFAGRLASMALDILAAP